jgi:sugar lactone lactonase YvrE
MNGLRTSAFVYALVAWLLAMNLSGCGSVLTGVPIEPGPQSTLLVADSTNNRILIFDAPFSTGQSASVVLGQADFGGTVPATTASGLNVPVNVAADVQGNLWVSDVQNNRILRYSPPFTNGMAANLVVGQQNFASASQAMSQNGLALPHGLAFDGKGDLWVADSYNARVLEFTPPFSSGMDASLVLGQTSFTGSVCNSGESGLCFPTNLTFDSGGNLWVADGDNYRVVEYKPPFVTGESASVVLGQPNLTSTSQGFGDAGLYLPGQISFDATGNLWVSDQGNWRVLEFAAPFSNGEAAAIVLGFSDFTSRVNTNSQSDMTNPVGTAFDSAGNLFVGDSGGHRILIFAPPFSNGMNASKEIGEPSFGTIVGGTSASTLSNPWGISIVQ